MDDLKSELWCVSWCHGRKANVTWRWSGTHKHTECVVRARVRGTMRTMVRPTFAQAVTALSRSEW